MRVGGQHTAFHPDRFQNHRVGFPAGRGIPRQKIRRGLAQRPDAVTLLRIRQAGAGVPRDLLPDHVSDVTSPRRQPVNASSRTAQNGKRVFPFTLCNGQRGTQRPVVLH